MGKKKKRVVMQGGKLPSRVTAPVLPVEVIDFVTFCEQRLHDFCIRHSTTVTYANDDQLLDFTRFSIHNEKKSELATLKNIAFEKVATVYGVLATILQGALGDEMRDAAIYGMNKGLPIQVNLLVGLNCNTIVDIFATYVEADTEKLDSIVKLLDQIIEIMPSLSLLLKDNAELADSIYLKIAKFTYYVLDSCMRRVNALPFEPPEVRIMAGEKLTPKFGYLLNLLFHDLIGYQHQVRLLRAYLQWGLVSGQYDTIVPLARRVVNMGTIDNSPADNLAIAALLVQIAKLYHLDLDHSDRKTSSGAYSTACGIEDIYQYIHRLISCEQARWDAVLRANNFASDACASLEEEFLGVQRALESDQVQLDTCLTELAEHVKKLTCITPTRRCLVSLTVCLWRAEKQIKALQATIALVKQDITTQADEQASALIEQEFVSGVAQRAEESRRRLQSKPSKFTPPTQRTEPVESPNAAPEVSPFDEKMDKAHAHWKKHEFIEADTLFQQAQTAAADSGWLNSKVLFAQAGMCVTRASHALNMLAAYGRKCESYIGYVSNLPNPPPPHEKNDYQIANCDSIIANLEGIQRLMRDCRQYLEQSIRHFQGALQALATIERELDPEQLSLAREILHDYKEEIIDKRLEELATFSTNLADWSGARIRLLTALGHYGGGSNTREASTIAMAIENVKEFAQTDQLRSELAALTKRFEEIEKGTDLPQLEARQPKTSLAQFMALYATVSKDSTRQRDDLARDLMQDLRHVEDYLSSARENRRYIETLLNHVDTSSASVAEQPLREGIKTKVRQLFWSLDQALVVSPEPQTSPLCVPTQSNTCSDGSR